MIGQIVIASIIASVLSQNCQSNQAIYFDSCVDYCPNNTAIQMNYGSAYCIQCDATKFLIPSPNGDSCVCAKQTYLDRNQNECIPCDYTCLSCSGPTKLNCLSCDTSNYQTNRVKSGNSCVCAPGFYDDQILQSTVCQKCHSDCKTCTGSQDSDCIVCSDGKVKNQFNQCICQNGFVSNNLGQCVCNLPFVVFPDGLCKNPVTSCGIGQIPDLSGSISKIANNVGALFKPGVPLIPGNKGVPGQFIPCTCQSGLSRIKGLCRTCGVNQVYNSRKGKCQCVSGGFKIKNNTCVVCPSNQIFNKRTEQCDCKKNEQKTETGSCIRCPNKSVYMNGECACIYNFYRQQSGKCQRCTKRSEHPACTQDIHQVDKPYALSKNQIWNSSN